MKRRKIAFIINPVSGVGKQKTIEKAIDHFLDHKKFDAHIVYTKFAGHATELARKEVEKETEVVVAVGGDGSINEVGKALMHTATTLAIIPCGSGNGLARHLGIDLDPEKAIQQINSFEERNIDSVKINDNVFLSIAGVGFDAYIAHKFAKHHRRGFWGYSELVFKSFFQYEDSNYHIELEDGQHLEREAFFIALANSNQFGYNTKIAPKANLSDGKVDVCIVKKPSLAQIPNLARLLFNDRIHESEMIEYLQVKNLKISRKEEKFVNIDGESITMDKELNIEVIPSSVKLLAF